MITVYKFSADWCGPCKVLAPQFANIKNANPDVNFIDVDVQTQKDIAAQFAVRSIPAVIVLKNGVVLKNLVGLQPMVEFQKAIDAAKNA